MGITKNKAAICFYEKYGYTFKGTTRTINLGVKLVEIRLKKEDKAW